MVRRCPATVFLISGIFALVPGAGLYYTAYYFIMGDNAMAVAKGEMCIRDRRTGGLREIFGIDLPWLLDAFGPVKQDVYKRQRPYCAVTRLRSSGAFRPC